MNSDQKTRVLIGILVVVVVGLLAYAAFGGRRAASKRAPAATQVAASEASASSEPAPGLPNLRIEADSPVATGSLGHRAQASSESVLSYSWTIIGGTFEGRYDGASVTWTAGAGKETVLVCQGTNAEGKSNTATLRVPLHPVVAINRFQADRSVITEGASTKLSWSVANAVKLGLEPGGQDLSGNPNSSMDVRPGKTTSYTLAALDPAGIATSQTVEVKVVPAPQLLSLRGDPVGGSARAYAIVAEFQGGKAELKRGGQVLASAESSPLSFQVTDLELGGVLLVTVTNEAGSSVSNTLTLAARK